MSLDSISAASNPASATTVKKEDKSLTGLSGNLTDFLNLLTTQLKNQDPTSPLDTSQFTQQLIGFSGIEQQINTNGKLDKLVESQSTTALSAQLASGVNYIGKMVEIESNQFHLSETGEPKFAYDVPRGTAHSVITITTDKGQIIGSFKGSTIEGKQNLVWDGKGADGERLPPGYYRFSVNLVDSENQNASATTYVLGEVSGIQMDKGEMKVVVDDNYVISIDEIKSVEQKTI